MNGSTRNYSKESRSSSEVVPMKPDRIRASSSDRYQAKTGGNVTSEESSVY